MSTGHIKQSINLPPTMAALFLERLAQQVRDNRLGIQVIQQDGDGIVTYSPFMVISAGVSLDDAFFINLVEVLLTELRGGSEK